MPMLTAWLTHILHGLARRGLPLALALLLVAFMVYGRARVLQLAPLTIGAVALLTLVGATCSFVGAERRRRCRTTLGRAHPRRRRARVHSLRGNSSQR